MARKRGDWRMTDTRVFLTREALGKALDDLKAAHPGTFFRTKWILNGWVIQRFEERGAPERS